MMVYVLDVMITKGVVMKRKNNVDNIINENNCNIIIIEYICYDNNFLVMIITIMMMMMIII